MRSRRQAPDKGTQMKMLQKKFSCFFLLVSAGMEKRKGPSGARGWCYLLGIQRGWRWSRGLPPARKAELGTRDVHERRMGVIPSSERWLVLLFSAFFPGDLREDEEPNVFLRPLPRVKPAPAPEALPSLRLFPRSWDMLVLFKWSLAFPIWDEMLGF